MAEIQFAIENEKKCVVRAHNWDNVLGFWPMTVFEKAVRQSVKSKQKRYIFNDNKQVKIALLRTKDFVNEAVDSDLTRFHRSVVFQIHFCR